MPKENSKSSKTALKLFAFASERVSAYKKFLHAHKIKPQDIRTIEDFQTVPIMDKVNYLRAYPFEELVPDGKIPPMVSASSGSSGQPFYWPRGDEQEEQGGKIHDVIFKDVLKVGSSKTLVIVCFSMGNWIAGNFTAASCRYLARKKGYNISVITPGIEKKDILAILQNFAPLFEKVVLAGYPPFLMDIVTEAQHHSIDLSRFDLKFLLAGENFSEKWRAALFAHLKRENTSDASVSIYGTADAGAIGHENPITFSIRKHATLDEAFRKELFGDVSFVPTVVQYYPQFTHFELVHNELVFSTKTGIPLIRYNIKDKGIIIPIKQAMAVLKKYGYDKEISKEDLKKWNYPLVTLNGRNDVSVTFYALNVYPENFKAGLEDASVASMVTGKFIAATKSINSERDQELSICVELSKGIKKTAENRRIIGKSLFDNLIKLNTEYRKLYNSIGKKALPKILLVEEGDPLFAIKKSKHSWVKK